MTILLNILFVVILITLILVCVWTIFALTFTGIDLFRDFWRSLKK